MHVLLTTKMMYILSPCLLNRLYSSRTATLINPELFASPCFLPHMKIAFNIKAFHKRINAECIFNIQTPRTVALYTTKTLCVAVQMNYFSRVLYFIPGSLYRARLLVSLWAMLMPSHATHIALSQGWREGWWYLVTAQERQIQISAAKSWARRKYIIGSLENPAEWRRVTVTGMLQPCLLY